MTFCAFRRAIAFAALLVTSTTSSLFAQSSAEDSAHQQGILDRTHIGGYGEITLTDPNGTEKPRLDVPRFVIYLDHYFSDVWAFKSETEIEHVKLEAGAGGEVALEQAYLDYHASNHLGWRVGLLTIPIGIINQTHEPNTYYSVERPLFDQQVIPTTWREIGTGVYGDLVEGLKYQLYLSEGLRAEGFTAESLEEAKQEGSSGDASNDGIYGSDASHPAVSAKIDILPISGLRIGLSSYYQPVTEDSLPGGGKAPVFAGMVDARYEIGGLRLRGIEGIVSIGDADSIAAMNHHLFKQAVGGYIEAAYNVMPLIAPSAESELLPFLRFENFTFTHVGLGNLGVFEHSVANKVVTAGLAFKPLDNLILKADYRWITSDENEAPQQFALAAGYSF